MSGITRQDESDQSLPHVRAGIDACVHCGFCLQACPTYLTLEDENDSPRGRIVLMRSVLERETDVDNDTLHTHISRCLGCRACETACPSGVPYGELLEATRASIGAYHRLPMLARLLLFIIARPILLRPAMMFARLLAATPIPTLTSTLSGNVGFAMAMLSAAEVPLERGSYDPDPVDDLGTAALLDGCIMDGIFQNTNHATIRVLTHNGYTMMRVPRQQCCGALHLHAGDLETAQDLARENIEAFSKVPTDFIVTNSAGCGAMLRQYGHLLRDDPRWRDQAQAFSARVRDVSELLADAGPRPGGSLPFRVTYDAPCHLHHAQRVTAAPLKVLDAIPGLERIPLPDADRCCGSAGIYSLVEPSTSEAVLSLKLAEIQSTGAALVATGNPGCLMQIGAGMHRAGMQAKAVHPVDLLDASYAAL